MSYGIQGSADLVQACFKVAEGELFTRNEARALGRVIASIIDDLPAHQERSFKRELRQRGRAPGRIDNENLRMVMQHVHEPFWQSPTYERSDGSAQYYGDVLESVLHVADVSGLAEAEMIFAGRMVDNMAKRMTGRQEDRFMDVLRAKVRSGTINRSSLKAVARYTRVF